MADVWLDCYPGPLVMKSPQALQIFAHLCCSFHFPSCYSFFCGWISLVILQACYNFLSALQRSR